MPPTIRHRNGTIFLDNTPLQEGAFQETYLTAEGTAAASTLTVKSITAFAINQILLIEDIGTENAEIVKTHASTAPTGSTVTLSAALAKTHPVGSKVYIIAFDQVVLYHATALAGSKTALTLNSGVVSLQPDVRIQRYKETEFTTGFYVARYKESIGGTFSDYTDYITYNGWATNTVGYMIDTALRELKLTLSDIISRFDCYTWLTEMLREVEGKQVRWPDHYAFNAILGQTTAGNNVTAMPTDAYDTESNKSLLAVRVGTGAPLNYLDPIEFDELFDGIETTTTRSSTSVGATTLPLTNSYDFPTSGSVSFYVSGTLYSVTYTGVTRDTAAGATGALTGVPASGTGSVSIIIPSGTYIWAGASFGTPTDFTIRNTNIETYPVPDASNLNIYADYAKVATTIDSDGDTIDLQRFDMAQNYLTWRIKMKARNDNNLDQNDGYCIKYKEKLNDAIRTSAPSQIRQRPQPRINRMSKH
jgi:hypothetical protein